MEIPVGLSVPSATPAKGGDKTLIGGLQSSNDTSFSDQFEGSVKRLQANRASSTKGQATQGAKPAQSEVSADTGTDKTTVPTTPEQAVATPAATTLNAELPKGLATHANDADLLQRAPGLLNALTGIAEKRGIDLEPAILSLSGNTLPPAEEVDLTQLELQLAEIDLNESYQLPANSNINFDPLGQATETAAQIATLAAAHFADQKLSVNGKNTATDFFAVSNTVLSNEKPLASQLSDTLLDKVIKPAAEFGLGAMVNKSTALPNASLNGEVLINGMHQLAPTTAQTMPAATALDKPSLLLDTPMSNARWGQDFNQRVQWMVNQAVSGAEIRLNPQHMGPIEVRIQIQNEQATIAFTAQHGATREAIDAALPKLRELLGEQNVNVVDVDVSQHSFADQRDQQALNTQQDGLAALGDSEQDDAIFNQTPNDQTRSYNGLFNDFA